MALPTMPMPHTEQTVSMTSDTDSLAAKSYKQKHLLMIFRYKACI